MNECYLSLCRYHSHDGPFCKMDTCLMSEAELKSLEDEKQKVELDQLYRESCEELFDDSGTL